MKWSWLPWDAKLQLAVCAASLACSIAVRDATLHSAVLAFSGFSFLGAVIDSTTAEGDPKPLYGLVGTLIGTSIVVLGLLTVFGSEHPPVSVKVGALSLTTGILVGLQLIQKLLPPGEELPTAPDHKPGGFWHRRSVDVFTLSVYGAMWALALGLLCIAMALAYR